MKLKSVLLLKHGICRIVIAKQSLHNGNYLKMLQQRVYMRYVEQRINGVCLCEKNVDCLTEFWTHRYKIGSNLKNI